MTPGARRNNADMDASKTPPASSFLVSSAFNDILILTQTRSYISIVRAFPFITMVGSPKYLTGDKEGIKDFIDSFDVSKPQASSDHENVATLRSLTS